MKNQLKRLEIPWTSAAGDFFPANFVQNRQKTRKLVILTSKTVKSVAWWGGGGGPEGFGRPMILIKKNDL